jgi:hypothetical protein
LTITLDKISVDNLPEFLIATPKQKLTAAQRLLPDGLLLLCQSVSCRLSRRAKKGDLFMSRAIPPATAVSSTAQENEVASGGPSPPWYVETIRAVALHRQSEKRLSILSEADELRLWSSLDDQRFCTLCKKTFSGRQVQIRRLTNGKDELRCATEGCNSSPQQWEYPENPGASDRVDSDWWRPSKRTSGSMVEQVAKANPDLVKRDRDGKLQTVRYDVVTATLLDEFLKEHQKVQRLEAALAAVNERLKEQDAKIDKVNAKIELTKPTSQKVIITDL